MGIRESNRLPFLILSELFLLGDAKEGEKFHSSLRDPFLFSKIHCSGGEILKFIAISLLF